MTETSIGALEAALLGSGGGIDDTDDWGGADRMGTLTKTATGTNYASCQPWDADFSSLEMEATHLMTTGREPTHEELMEYLERFKLQTFLTDVIMFVARHMPADPFEFLLNHIHAMVMKHRVSGNQGIGASETKAQTFSHLHEPPPHVTEEQRKKVVLHVAAVLRHDGVTDASASRLFEEFGSQDKMTEENFGKLFEHLQKTWGLQEEDGKLISEVLKRWRFRANAAKGTRGLPLWPLARADFCDAYPSLLRFVRDRYVPIGGSIHRSMFIGKAHGSVDDRYDWGIKLGRGAYGEVRLVTLKDTKDRRVCKRVERQQQKVPQDELQEEVDLLRGLDHPHIIRIFECFETEETVDMIMEPAFGGTLTHLVQGLYCNPEGEHLDKRPAELQETWLAVALQQMLSALEYAHNVAGVIHKDIKTDNVLLVGRPKLSAQDMLKEPVHIMLADFGIAEVFSPIPSMMTAVHPEANTPMSPTSGGGTPVSITKSAFGGRSEKVGGTPSYMSPEMFKGSFTEKSDMWSMGVMVFQMMSGLLPYKADNLLMQANIVCNPRRHPPWDVLTKYKWSLGARWLVQQMLSKEEATRPTASEAAKDPWLSKMSVSHDNEPATQQEREALHSQHLESHLTKMAMTCVTSQLNLSQLHHMNLRFKHYDTSGDGRLGHVEMRQVLEEVGVKAEDSELLIESLDSDHSGVIEYSEFVAGCMDITNSDVKSHLRVAFNIFDLDGSGSITLEELRHVLTEGVNSSTSMVRPNTPGMTTMGTGSSSSSMLPDGKTVEEVMAELDVNHGGKVDFKEFEKYLMDEHTKAGEKLHKASSK